MFRFWVLIIRYLDVIELDFRVLEEKVVLRVFRIVSLWEFVVLEWGNVY